MTQSPRMRRAQRRERNKTQLDLNLVSLIDIFTILIFFLLANAMDVEVLPSTKSVKLPESTSIDAPKASAVVVVSDQEITVQGVKVALVSEVMDAPNEVIAALKEELENLASRKSVQQDGKDARKVVTIMGDKDIPYRLLRKVMVTCAQANYSEISFAVLKKKV